MVHCLVKDPAPHYVGLPYRLNIHIPEDYPKSAPLVRFATIIYHIQLDEQLPEPLFYLDLDWGKKSTTLSDLVNHAHFFISDGADHAPGITIFDAENIWRHHREFFFPFATNFFFPAPDCRCEVFPRPYSDLKLMNRAERLESLRVSIFEKKWKLTEENVFFNSQFVYNRN